jgi:hypothetical protein
VLIGVGVIVARVADASDTVDELDVVLRKLAEVVEAPIITRPVEEELFDDEIRVLEAVASLRLNVVEPESGIEVKIAEELDPDAEAEAANTDESEALLLELDAPVTEGNAEPSLANADSDAEVDA